MRGFGIKPCVSFCSLVCVITQSYSETTLQWIEHLGCFNLNDTTQNIPSESQTLGRCQHYCMQHDNTTYFAFKQDTSCICFPTFNSALHNRTSPCSYQVFHVISCANIEGSGNCIATKCLHYDIENIDDIQYKSVRCSSTMTPAVCGNGVTAGTNYKSQEDAFTYCHEMSSFLPGPSQFPCKSMKKSDQGHLSNFVWSAIFRVSYNDTDDETTTTRPSNSTIFSQSQSNKGTAVTLEHVTTYATNKTPLRNASAPIIKRTTENSVLNATHVLYMKTSNEQKLGVIIGVVIGVAVTLAVILLAVCILYRKRKHGRPDNTSVTERSSVSSAKTIEEETSPDNAYTEHIQVNGDQYAIVNRRTVPQRKETNDSGLLFTLPSLDYDELNHTRRITISESSNYDVANFDGDPETTYQEAYGESSSSDVLDLYDHVR